MVFAAYKQELGWTDYRFTNFQHIKKWWEIIFCVYTMISLSSPPFLSLNQAPQIETEVQDLTFPIIFLIERSRTIPLAQSPILW
jgi:hypothetical protein